MKHRRSEALAPRPEPIAVHSPFNDLCSTCNDAPGCRLALRRTGPIHSCQEFDDHQAPAPRAIKDSSMGLEPLSPQDAAREGTYKGICANCEERSTCSFPKPYAGIWHCEEYR
jgi:hypothetical protein